MAQSTAIKRPYRLSEAGLASLRSAALRNRPWRHSTGPRTLEGKRRSSRNALKFGHHTAKKIAEYRENARIIKLGFEVSRLKMKMLEAPEGSDEFWDLFEQLARVGEEEGDQPGAVDKPG